MGIKRLHRLLQRQLRREGIDADALEGNLAKFVAAVDQAYRGFDEDRELLERSLHLSSKELLDTSGQLKAVLNAFPDLILQLDYDGRILAQKSGTADRALSEENIFFGKDYVGKQLQNLASEDRVDALEHCIEKVKETGVIQSVEYHSETDSGDTKFFEARILPFAEGQLIAAIRDISDKKIIEAEKSAAELELRRSSKMEAVGRLAGGIAHDFNNILHSVMGYTQLAMRKTEAASTLFNYLQEVIIATNRGKELVEQILIFSRWRERRHVLLSLEQITVEVENLLKPNLPRNIMFIVERLMDGEDVIVGDPVQLHQSLTNLFKNAIQAMEKDGGELCVHVERVEHAAAAGSKLPAGSYYCLVVQDSGPGMKPEVQEKVFEPFFTTKRPGEGTGLGLSVVHGVMEDHGGAITLESTEGKGTVFRLFFPVSGEQGAVQDYSKFSSQQIVYGSGRILLVDDEKALSAVIAEMLRGLGYSVTVFNDPAEALNTFKENPLAHDLVITDQTMPSISGIELARRVLEERADIPVVMLSGYSENVSNNEALDAGCKMSISKPISLEELSKAVFETLVGQHN